MPLPLALRRTNEAAPVPGHEIAQPTYTPDGARATAATVVAAAAGLHLAATAVLAGLVVARAAGWRTAGVLSLLPLLAVATFVAPAWINNPLCYQQTSEGDIALPIGCHT